MGSGGAARGKIVNGVASKAPRFHTYTCRRCGGRRRSVGTSTMGLCSWCQRHVQSTGTEGGL